jgi:hypothetical protein
MSESDARTVFGSPLGILVGKSDGHLDFIRPMIWNPCDSFLLHQRWGRDACGCGWITPGGVIGPKVPEVLWALSGAIRST